MPGNWDLDFHTYGQGQSTPLGPGEVFIIAEAVASTQELATGLVSTARIGMIVSFNLEFVHSQLTRSTARSVPGSKGDVWQLCFRHRGQT